jgi:MinD-like ATPase involved in chromosome partitioning or flagellar assembly
MNEFTMGQIFTFYSYKGGTGRSMALANVACLLAEKHAEEQDILMIDWDLEAPGLHRFFEKGLAKDGDLLSSQPGLIDLFYEMQERCQQLGNEEEITDVFFDKLNIEKFIIKTGINSLYLMTAGIFDTSYSKRVNRFNWENFFNQSPWLISKFANYLSQKYRFVLIDSRTGSTDISSICTALMPEKLVLVFTPNRQSLTGVLNVIKNATDYRKQSDDLRPLMIFPLVSRVENAEEDLQKIWRFGDIERGIVGYQPEFESALQNVYSLSECDLTDYFNEVKIQHVPKYSFGEEIAVLSTNTEDRLSLAVSYENFLQRFLIDAPWIKFEKKSDQAKDEYFRKNIKTTNRPLRVFICHSSSDKTVVRELYQKLRAETWLQPWLDEAELIPGQDWNFEIEKAVEVADVILVCLSKNSVTKEGYIQREIRIVLDFADYKPEGTVFIIPIRLEETDPPRRLRQWQYLDYFPETKRNDAFQKLLLSLRTRVGYLGLAYERSVFISYAWGGNQEEVVNQIDQSLQKRGIKVVRDKRDLGYKSSIKEFIERLGQNNCVIVIISDKYLRSKKCMYELVEIIENKQFANRVFPIVLSDANIFDPVARLDYVEYWNLEKAKLNERIKMLSDVSNLQGINEELNNLDRFREAISGLTSILKDMNTLTPELHINNDFSLLYEAIENRLNDTEA